MDRPKPQPNVRMKHYDVLLNSYMSSGSTLTGIILGWRVDTFYLYEPLWKISTWTYWHGKTTVCRSDRLDCMTVQPGQAIPNNNKNVPPGSLEIAMKILRNTYDCQLNEFERTVLQRLTVEKGGPSWSNTATCIKMEGRYKSHKSCIHSNMFNISSKCKIATHRVTKVLRLSIDLLADILHARKNLKVIHLFRDPRAIINSRMKSWYPKYADNGTIENAKSLCNKMLYDFRAGQKLLRLYPDRFKFIYYEDLVEKPFDKSKKLFKYLGMDLDENKYPELRNLPLFTNGTKQNKRVKNTAFWWRMSLKMNIVRKMDCVCKDVYAELGYKSLENTETYRNMSFSSVNIPKKYLIL